MTKLLFDPDTVRKGLAVGAAANAILLAAGWIIFRTTAADPTSWIGLAADFAVLAAYGGIAWWAVPATGRRDPLLLATAVTVGGFSGIVFGAEILLEYALLPDDNTTFGYAEFGAVLTLYLAAAFATAYRTGKIGRGVLAATWAAVIGSTVWLGCLLATTYLFHGSERQARVFLAEGNYEDFRHSGMQDFDAFMMQDFMGAAFFHLLLLPAVAALLGIASGAAGKGVAWWQSGRAAGADAPP
jgi:hypothetical protein